MIIAHRFHEFSYGHRVVGQGGKCEHLHGHNGVVTFHVVEGSYAEQYANEHSFRVEYTD